MSDRSRTLTNDSQITQKKPASYIRIRHCSFNWNNEILASKACPAFRNSARKQSVESSLINNVFILAQCKCCHPVAYKYKRAEYSQKAKEPNVLEPYIHSR